MTQAFTFQFNGIYSTPSLDGVSSFTGLTSGLLIQDCRKVSLSENFWFASSFSIKKKKKLILILKIPCAL